MKQEDKELLLKDLCARLPYKPIVINENLNGGYPRKLHFGDLSVGKYIDSLYVEGTKIYLRPMSSMTEEEKQKLERLINEKLNRNTDEEDDEWTPWVLHDTTGIRNSVGGERFYFDDMSFIYDWLNAHHFDYRGLIEKGLALEAPKDMYNLKEE